MTVGELRKILKDVEPRTKVLHEIEGGFPFNLDKVEIIKVDKDSYYTKFVNPGDHCVLLG